VQVSWAGYPGTTGLDAIDYRLTDPYLEPADAIDTAPSQESIRLPDSFWCYDPLTDSPTVNALPALSAGHITFGSLNYFCKINEGVISLWSRVLHAVNDSRLLLLSKEGGHRERALKDFERFGIAADRIDWFKPAPRAQYLAAYHRIDLGLDSVPYNGHSTSLDSFWMGAPVVTLVGSRVVGRAGLSQLTNLGLPELIGFSPEHFVRIAVGLAQDPARLSELRSTLRDRMRASPLMDAPRFTRNIEAAYREMWRRWCA
jgi:predicted O-linked N-acetylglucosamine transferase (SPINDLY family)